MGRRASLSSGQRPFVWVAALTRDAAAGRDGPRRVLLVSVPALAQVAALRVGVATPLRFAARVMAVHSKEREALVAEGTWRADRHAGLVDVAGIPGPEADSVLWNQLEAWQRRFDEAAADVEARGTTLDSKGQAVQNPSCKVMKDASSEIRELCKVLGIGPLNRSRLGASSSGDGEPDDVPGAPPRVRR